MDFLQEIPTKEPIIIDGKGLNGKITGIINIRYNYIKLTF